MLSFLCLYSQKDSVENQRPRAAHCDPALMWESSPSIAAVYTKTEILRQAHVYWYSLQSNYIKKNEIWHCNTVLTHCILLKESKYFEKLWRQLLGNRFIAYKSSLGGGAYIRWKENSHDQNIN